MTESQAPEVDERPQRRREWSGAFSSVILPLLAVVAVVLAIWLLEGRPGFRSSSVSPLSEATGDYRAVNVGPADGSARPEVGRSAPDFVLPDLEGAAVRLSDQRGKVVLVNFWATWCIPCKREIPDLVSVYERYRAEGFEIVAVNLQESASAVRPFVDDWGMTYINVLDQEGKVARQYALTGLPETFFIDREGVLRDIRIGQVKEEYLECAVVALLSGKPPQEARC